MPAKKTQKLKFLKGVDQIRQTPGMYIGDVHTPKTLIKEMVDNATDEYLNGYAKKIEIEYDPSKGYYTVRDNGRGIPLYKVKEHGNKVAARLLLEKTFSGGKFDKSNYKISSGLHGLGLTAINALSKKAIIRVKRGSKLYTIHAERGKITYEEFLNDDRERGNKWWKTEVTCYPDSEIFISTKTTIDVLPLQLAMLTHPKGTIILNNKQIEPFDFTKEVKDNFFNNKLFDVKVEGKVLFIDRSSGKELEGNPVIDMNFGWVDTEVNDKTKGSVNLTPCHNGFHVNTCKRIITQELAAYAKAETDHTLLPRDCAVGLRVFVNLLTARPHFTSQSKEKLSLAEDIDKDYLELVRKAITEAIKSDKETTDALIEKIVEYKKLTQKLSDKDFIKSVVKKGTDKRTSKGVEGVYECTTTERQKAELYIVEGKSAAGNLKKVRSLRYQAVLPLRGKPLNAVTSNNIQSILSNKEMKMIVNAIGVGISPDIELEASRYGKIILCADADPDGCNISALLIGALAYLVPDLIDAGLVYEAQAPLYKQDEKFMWDDENLNRRKQFDRYKGLGSMDASDLKTALLDPKTRILRKITLSNRDELLKTMSSSFRKKRLMITNNVIVD